MIIKRLYHDAGRFVDCRLEARFDLVVNNPYGRQVDLRVIERGETRKVLAGEPYIFMLDQFDAPTLVFTCEEKPGQGDMRGRLASMIEIKLC